MIYLNAQKQDQSKAQNDWRRDQVDRKKWEGGGHTQRTKTR